VRFVPNNYIGTILVDTARRSEACAPAQQQAQVKVMNTMLFYVTGSRTLSRALSGPRPKPHNVGYGTGVRELAKISGHANTLDVTAEHYRSNVPW
jgi:hypothetical protein